jgi:hypothetical protein
MRGRERALLDIKPEPDPSETSLSVRNYSVDGCRIKLRRTCPCDSLERLWPNIERTIGRQNNQQIVTLGRVQVGVGNWIKGRAD